MQKEFGQLGILWRPSRVSPPGIRPALKGADLPRRLVTAPVEVMPEECRSDRAELNRCFVASERDDANTVPLIVAPFTVIPRTGDHETRVVGIAQPSTSKDLPGSPGIFLVPETGDV